jgi:HAD superfamily hydrolase (TIGR01509 family)
MRSLAIFDLDGVLIDSEAAAANVLSSKLTGAGYPVSVADVVERFIGTDVKTILSSITAEKGIQWHSEFHSELEEDIQHQVYLQLAPTEGIASVLSAMPASAWCIASNSRMERIAKCLDLSGLSARFRPRAFSASMVGSGKPAPDLFLLAAREFAVEPERCLVVEDTVVGILAGRAAGMKTIGFVGGSHISTKAQAGRLRDAGAEAIVETAAELADHLDRHGCMAPEPWSRQ